jgi:hypothetical protein
LSEHLKYRRPFFLTAFDDKFDDNPDERRRTYEFGLWLKREGRGFEPRRSPSHLQVEPLSEESRKRYTEWWHRVEQTFVEMALRHP